MKTLRYILSILASISLIIALLIGSVEICCFYQRDFYGKVFAEERSYETVGMTLEDEIGMMDYTLDYLQGDYTELSYTTTMWGEKRDFYNDRVKAHMVDVQALNLNAVSVMNICFELTILLLMLVLAICFKTAARDYAARMFFRSLSVGMLIGTATFALIVGVGALIVMQDFNAFWIKFHHVFFTNDLWLLDPRVDFLVCVTTETLFAALVARCATLFGISLIILLAASICYLCVAKKKNWIIRLGAIVLALALTSGSSPVYAADEINALDSRPDISADNAILIDADSGQILYAKNAYASAYPASTTKVMTALLALENLQLQDTVTFSKTAILSLTPGASHIGMKIGETITVEDALYGLLLPSANEVANALAEKTDGSMSAFVDHMNSRAIELGCKNTSFANPNGLHNDEHTTCAYDLAQIFRACINNPLFLSIDSNTTHVIAPTVLVEESRPMKTTHKMMLKGDEHYDERVICGKTGHTDQALGCLVTYARSGSTSLICVVLHSQQPNQYTDTESLLNYGFNSFTRTSASAVAEYIFSGKGNSFYDFAESTPLPIYSLKSSSLLIVPTDLSLLTWGFTNDAKSHVTLKSGSLELETVVCVPASIDKSIRENGLLPIDKIPRLQKVEKKNYTPLIIAIVAVVLIITIIILVLNSRTYRMYHKKRATKIVKNIDFKK